MAIPTDIKALVKDYAFMNYSDVERDDLLDDIYDREAREVFRELDLITAREDIDTVEDQSIYTTQSTATRILGVLHAQKGLSKTTAVARDRTDPTWMSDASSTPEIWWQDKPAWALDGLSSGSAEDFTIHPPPDSDAAGTGANGLYVYEVIEPASLDPNTTWINHYLALKAVGPFIVESAEEKETEQGDREVNARETATLFSSIAGIWDAVIREKMSI